MKWTTRAPARPDTNAILATEMAARLLEEGIYVVGFSFPVVPKGRARIRTQMSAGHTPAQIDESVAILDKALEYPDSLLKK